MDVRFLSEGCVVINGIEYRGNSISVSDSTLIVDGEAVELPRTNHFDVVIHGSVQTVSVNTGSIQADTIIHARTMGGDIRCKGIEGSVKTMSGNVYCEHIVGDVRTMSGSVSNQPKVSDK